MTFFYVFAVVVVLLLWWIGSNVYAIAKRGDPAPSNDPHDKPLTRAENRALSKRPDHSSATSADWLAWHEKYKDQIDTEYFMPADVLKPGREG